MQEAVPIGEGSMIAILGTETDVIINLIKFANNEKGVCEIANDNADGQVIVSGNKENIKSIAKNIKRKKLNQFL